MRIGIDIMGGDYAPRKTIEGVILANKELAEEVEIILFGKEQEILIELKNHKIPANKFTIIDSSEVINMEDHPSKAFKSKPNSSIVKGLSYLRDDKIDGFCSAGNTGAMFVGGFYSVQPIKGVLRPALATIMPREDGEVFVLLDVGANADCKPDVLNQFGLLGSLFAKNICKKTNPRVALLNLGEEKSKGNMLTQAAYNIMENNTDYNFVGNIESRDLFDSNIDVVVCDGFTGNIVLKEAEAFYNLIKKRNKLDDYFKRFNYEYYGGTPIIGLNKNVIIGHGISNEIAIKNMILLTNQVSRTQLIKEIKNTLYND